MLYKELQPADLYMIRLPYSFSDYDRQLLTLFYQPLVGAESISLYLTLWADGEHNDKEQWSHYHLMNVLGMPMGKFFRPDLLWKQLASAYLEKNNGGWKCIPL